MALFRGRLFALSAFSFIGCLFACSHFSDLCMPCVAAVLFVCGLCAALSALLFSCSFRFALRRIVPVMMAFAVAALAAAASFLFGYMTLSLPAAEAKALDGRTCSLTGEVLSCVASESYFSSYDIALRELNGEASAEKLRLELDFPADLKRGDLISCEATFFLPPEQVGGYPLRSAYLARGIRLTATFSDVGALRLVGHSPDDLYDLADRLGEELEAILAESLSEKDEGLTAALLLGRKDGLSTAFTRDVRRLGISHLLALSGMHLTLLTGGLICLLKLLRCGRRLRCLILIPAVLFYLLLTGLPPSVVRAGVMLILYQLAFLLGRRPDSITALMSAVTLILVVSPYSIYDAGLVLSFLTMLSMVTVSAGLGGKFHRMLSRPPLPAPLAALLSSMLYTLVCGLFAYLFALPALWFYFEEVSLVGIPMTLLFSPLVQGQMASGALLLLFFWIPGLSWLLRAATLLFTRLILTLSASFSGARGIVLSLGYPFAGGVCALLLGAILLILLFSRRRRVSRLLLSGGAAVLAFAVCFASYQAGAQSGARVIYFNSGQNDAILLSSEGKTLICDLSSGGSGMARECVAAAGEFYSTEIEAYLLTHYHKRHISTISGLLRSVVLRTILLPEPETAEETEICEAISAAASEAGCDVGRYTAGDEAGLVFCGVTVRAAERGRLTRSTHPTLMLTFEGDGSRLLYLGASCWESAPEEAVSAVRSADAVIFGRHGPKIKSDFPVDCAGVRVEGEGQHLLILT